MSADKVRQGPDVTPTIANILKRKIPKLPGNALGQQIGRMLAEIAVELQDRIDEVKFHKLRTEALRGEIKTLAAIIMTNQADKRIVITRKEMDAIPEDVEVHVETPEPGVRIYTLRAVPAKKVILNG